mgnify:FL=1
MTVSAAERLKTNQVGYMQAVDRPIHFSTELFYPPFPLKTPVLQKLYYDLSRVPAAAYESADFGMPGPPRFYSRRANNAQSIALFLPDRLVVIEEWVDLPFERFLERVREVAERTLDAFEIGAFAAQTAVIRTTFALTHFNDARVFLIDHICGLEDRLGPFFGRPVGVGGIRFVFPPVPNHPGELHLIIESYRHSMNEVFVEAKTVYPDEEITLKGMEKAGENIIRVRRFISENVYPFLQQFDAAPTADN